MSKTLPCPKCQRPLTVRRGAVLTSIPPQYAASCDGCDYAGFVLCSDADAMVVLRSSLPRPRPLPRLLVLTRPAGATMEEARTTKALGDDIVAQGHADACIVLLPGWKASYCEGEPHPGGQYLKIAAEGETLPDHFCSRACEARKIAETAS